MQNQINDFSSESTSIEQLQQDLSEALLKAEDNLAGWKRTQADLENYRKRKESEATELVLFGKQAAIVRMLPVLDSLAQAAVHAPDLVDPKYLNWKQGLEGIIRQIDAVLKEIGVSKMEVIGKKFDPNLHEAVKEIPAASAEDAEGLIREELQAGYLLQDKVLRPAQVVITKKTDSRQQIEN